MLGTMGRLLDNCNDPRFLNVEERFYRAIGHYLYYGNFTSTGIVGICRKAKVWCSTFYDHFKNMDDALEKYNHKHDLDIKNLCNEAIEEHLSTEAAICKILHFISHHKDYYRTILRRENPIPVFRIFEIFRPLITRNWSYYSRECNDLSFKILSGEFFGVIYFWGTVERFDDNKIATHAIHVARLAQNTTKRLS